MKLFKKFAGLLLVSAFALPMAAHAIPVHIEYEGTVNSTGGNGMGYTTGDTITGWFEFDTDDLIDANGDGSYLYSSGPVESNQSASVDNYANTNDYDLFIDDSVYGYDQLYLQDGSYEYCYNCASGNYYEYSYSYHALNLYEYAEWFDIDDIIGGGQSVIDVSSYYNYGNLYDYSYSYADSGYNGYQLDYSNQASFTLSSMTVNSAVPEPGMIGLMGLGLLGLVVARRRKQHAA